MILPPADTLKLLDDIKETGSFTFWEEDNWKVAVDKEEAPISKPPIDPADAVISPDKNTLLAVKFPLWSNLKLLDDINNVWVELFISTPVVVILWASISKPPIDRDWET